MHNRTFWTLCTFALCIATVVDAQIILRVDCAAIDRSPDGSTWAKAYRHVQEALTAAEGMADPETPVQIWVAACSYMADGGSTRSSGAHTSGSLSRTATFQLVDDVTIYGGFPTGGGDGAAGARDPDPETNGAVLSGDLNGNDGPGFTGNSENSYHVVTGSGTDASAALIGFTVRGGNSNGAFPNGNGGGLYNDGGSPTLIHCAFALNSSLLPPFGGAGAGMFNLGSSPTLLNCIFSGNLAGAGGGMINGNSSNPTLTNCLFRGNSAVIAGGGGMYNDGSDPTLTNCTLSGNAATTGFLPAGGGVYNTNSSPTLTNCVLWGNMAAVDPAIYNRDQLSEPVVTYSCIRDDLAGDGNVYPGTGNLDTDPRFVRNPDDGGDGWGVGANDDYGDLHLTTGSPCIDAGDNNADTNANLPDVQPLPPTDLDDTLRIIGGTVDMGAYERIPPPVPALNLRAPAAMMLSLTGIGALIIRRRMMTQTA